jgi:hypothetical protein
MELQVGGTLQEGHTRLYGKDKVIPNRTFVQLLHTNDCL